MTSTHHKNYRIPCCINVSTEVLFFPSFFVLRPMLVVFNLLHYKLRFSNKYKYNIIWDVTETADICYEIRVKSFCFNLYLKSTRIQDTHSYQLIIGNIHMFPYDSKNLWR